SVGWREVASQQRRHAHIGEQVRGIQSDLNRDRKFLPGEVLLQIPHQKHVIEESALSKVLILRAIDKQEWPAARFVPQLDVYHSIRIFVRIGIEEDAIDHAEDDSGRANSERQREHGGENKSRRFAEKAKRVVNILQEVPHSAPLSQLHWIDDSLGVLVGRTDMNTFQRTEGSAAISVIGIRLKNLSSLSAPVKTSSVSLFPSLSVSPVWRFESGVCVRGSNPIK